MMKRLQKLGKALMLPVAVLPICGILMGLGYALAPAVMGVPGAPDSGALYTIGFFLIKAGAAVIDNMAILFAIGVGVGLAKGTDGTAGVAALVSWLMMQTLLSTGVTSVLMPGSVADAVYNVTGAAQNAEGVWELTKELVSPATSGWVAFSKINNPFIGIIAGIVGAMCYNKFKDTKLPDVLAFFSGKRCVAIITGVVTIVVSAVLLFVWPIIFGVLVALGNAVKGLGVAGVGIYTFLNRLLIPTGLHHAVNNVFWFDTIGIGDLSHYWAGHTMGNPAEVTWSVGQYMAGFFPSMMFGIPGAALAMILTAKPEKRKYAIGIVGSAAICAFICGVTEPFEFSFMFLAFPLYIVYSLLYAVFAMVTVALGFRAGFCFSAGATDLVFSATLPAHAKTWLIIPLGIAAFAVFFAVFYFAIKKFNLMTPGREDDDQEGEMKIELANNDFTAMAKIILEGLGGAENIAELDHCITRLRLEVKDNLKVDEKKIKSSGISGIIRPSKTAVQVIVGPKVQFVFDEMEKLVK